MKTTIRGINDEIDVLVKVPAWMVGFIDWQTRQLSFSHPFKYWFWRTWFAPAKMIRSYNHKNCQNFYPDWMNGTGTKVRPLFGFVLQVPEGEALHYNWLRYLKRYKNIKVNLE